MGWARDRQTSFERLLGEFLTEEFQATPPKSEMQNFHDEVDEARFQADRVAAKVAEAKRRQADKVKTAEDTITNNTADNDVGPNASPDSSKANDPPSSTH